MLFFIIQYTPQFHWTFLKPNSCLCFLPPPSSFLAAAQMRKPADSLLSRVLFLAFGSSTKAPNLLVVVDVSEFRASSQDDRKLPKTLWLGIHDQLEQPWILGKPAHRHDNCASSISHSSIYSQVDPFIQTDGTFPLSHLSCTRSNFSFPLHSVSRFVNFLILGIFHSNRPASPTRKTRFTKFQRSFGLLH